MKSHITKIKGIREFWLIHTQMKKLYKLGKKYEVIFERTLNKIKI